MERNSSCSSFVRMRNPTPLFPLGLCLYKAVMATSERKAFCVLQFVKRESILSVQRAFWRQYKSDRPSPISSRRWYQQFQTMGCLCKGKSVGWSRVSEESVEVVRQSFLHSPKKYVRRASLELEMSSMTVWRVLRKRVRMKSYRFHLLQFLKPTCHIDRSNLCIKMQDAMMEEGFLDRAVFSDAPTFNISVKVHRCNVRIWGTENSHEMVQHERASPKIIVLCTCPHDRFMGLSFSMKTL